MSDILLAMMETNEATAACVTRLVASLLLLPAGLLAQAHSAPAAHPAAEAKPLLLVANQKDHSLSVIDPMSNKQVAAIDVGGVTGHEVAASPDGRTAYVPIYGDSGVGKAGTDGKSIAVIDLGSRRIVHTIAFSHGVRPHLPVFDPSGKVLYVTTELDRTLTAFDPQTYKVLGTNPTTQDESHMFALTRDGGRAYTANVGPGNISVIDLAAHKTIAVIPVAQEIQRISISRDDRMIFTSDQRRPQLAVIDTATNKVKQWVTLPAPGYGTASTHDGRYLLVAIRTLKQVAVVDLASMKVVRTIPMPGVPVEILVRPDGQAAYVSCGKQVAVIDTASLSGTAQITAGEGADGLAWAK